MKIIKQGRKQEGWGKELECKPTSKTGCGAVVFVDENDLHVGCPEGYDYLGDANGDEKLFFTCPTCKQKTWVKAPDHVFMNVNGRDR